MERWRWIVGYEGRYEVSDCGRVRSYVGRGRRTKILTVPTLLRPTPRGQRGYLGVSLGRRDPRYVHDLVLSAFVGPRPPGHEGAHGNDNPTDNLLTNLRWATHVENMADARAHGMNQGARNGGARLTESQVGQIKSRLIGGAWAPDIARAFGVSRNTIEEIAQGKSWHHVEPRGAVPYAKPGTRGEKNGRAKLSVADVERIREDAVAGVGRFALARRYAVSYMTIRRILIGENWRSVA